MPLFASARDISYLRRQSKELTDKVDGMEVLFYKLSLSETSVDIYDDAKKRMHMNPVLLTCIIDRNPQTTEKAMYGTDVSRLIDFKFLRDDLIDLQLVPEIGDIIGWNESYYEVDNNIDSQLIVGKDPDYSLQSNLENFGRDWSIICNTHLANINKLNLVKSR